MHYPITRDGLLVSHLQQDFLSLVPDSDELWPHLKTAIQEIGDVELTIYSTNATSKPLSPESGTVSVIVPTYNVSRFIVETLRSILSQGYQPLEICVVDDGSVDRTQDIVLGLMQEVSDTHRIRFLGIPHCGSPSLVRNMAIKHLTSVDSKYIAFMDGDDLYASDQCISVLVHVMETNPRILGAYGDYDWISESGSPLSPAAGLTINSKGQWKWRDGSLLTWLNLATGRIGVFHLQCLLVRNLTVPLLSYRPVGEDAEYYGRLFRKSREMFDGLLEGIHQVPMVIAHYRKRESSISELGGPANWQEPVDLYPFKRRQIDSNTIPLFFDVSGIPDKYVTKANVSEYLVRQSARLVFRKLRRNGLVAASNQLISILRNPLILWRTVPTVFATGLLFNGAVLAGVWQSLRGYLKRLSRLPKP